MTPAPHGYRPRLIDSRVDFLMGIYGAVCIEGPKACGKAWTAKNHSRSVFELGGSREGIANKRRTDADVLVAFEGETPHAIVEWQTVPCIWDATKYLVDQRSETGRFILTGSSTPAVKGIYHDGTGRIGLVRMRPMSLYESGDSSGAVSLRTLFDGPLKATEVTEPDLEGLVEVTMRGGWPSAIGKSHAAAVQYSRDYVESVTRAAQRMDGVSRNESKIRMRIRSLARNESTLASNETLVRDMAGSDDPESENRERETLSAHSLPEYNDVLERLFVVDNQPAFEFNARPPVRVGRKPKRHLSDPSLSIAALGLGKNALMDDPGTYGFMFESLCVRDLRVYAEADGGRVYHYRDDRGLEVDAIVQLQDGRYGAVEIELDEDRADRAAESLLGFDRFLERSSLPRPSFLCVLCGLAATAYTREDGVHVVPIRQLRDRPASVGARVDAAADRPEVRLRGDLQGERPERAHPDRQGPVHVDHGRGLHLVGGDLRVGDDRYGLLLPGDALGVDAEHAPVGEHDAVPPGLVGLEDPLVRGHGPPDQVGELAVVGALELQVLLVLEFHGHARPIRSGVLTLSEDPSNPHANIPPVRC